MSSLYLLSIQTTNIVNQATSLLHLLSEKVLNAQRQHHKDLLNQSNNCVYNNDNNDLLQTHGPYRRHSKQHNWGFIV